MIKKSIILITVLFGISQATTILKDSCVMRVGNKIITEKEVEDNISYFKAQLPGVNEDSLRAMIIQKLVNDNIILVAAEQDTTLTVTDDEVSSQMDTWIKTLKQQLGESGFKQELQNEGLTEQGLKKANRQKVYETILTQKYIQKYIQPKINITEKEIKSLYTQYKDSMQTPPEYRVSQILIGVRPDSTREAFVYHKALKIYREIKSGKHTFDDYVNLSDDDLTRDQGGDLGFVPYTAFPDSIVAYLKKLHPGDISRPIRGDYGWHIFEIVDTASGGVHLRHILFKVTASKASWAKALKKAKSILLKLKQGSSFDQMASRYSDDTQTKDLGGDLGWLKENFLTPSTVDTLKHMKKGDIKIIQSQIGYHITKLVDKKPWKKYTYDEAKPYLQQMLMQKKQQEELQKEIRRLKKKIYIGKC